MIYNEADVMDFIEENDVQFIRLAFCDIFGVQRNISIMPEELSRAFKEGIVFDAGKINGLGRNLNTYLVLVPDPRTVTILPWRPSHGRVARFYCNIRTGTGEPYEFDTRALLADAVEALKKEGFSLNVGAQCEFYLFKTDSQGHRTEIPFDRGGYLSIAPEDHGENVRREICLSMLEMGISPRSSYHERGPGQNQINFLYSPPLSSADNLATFETVVRTIASQNGLCATFEPKPLASEPGSGFHIDLSLRTLDGKGDLVADKYFIAGVMAHIGEITAFLNPTPQSYHRLGRDTPLYVTWATKQWNQLVRIPETLDGNSWMELRSPDPTANPYLAYALVIYAGLEGIRNKIELPPACEFNVATADAEQLKCLDRLPSSFRDAINIATQSDFVRKIIPDAVLEAYQYCLD